MVVSGQLHTQATFPWEKSLWYPLNRRMDGPQSQSGQAVPLLTALSQIIVCAEYVYMYHFPLYYNLQENFTKK